jgi:hypothetical protein
MLDPRATPRWTQTDITGLRDLLSTGAGIDGLMNALHRSEADICRMARRLQLSLRA